MGQTPLTPAAPPAEAPFQYAFNAPLSGAFKDVTGFAKVRLGEAPKAGSVRTIDLNGTFKVRDKKRFSRKLGGHPQTPRQYGNSITLTPKAAPYQGGVQLETCPGRSGR